MAKLTIVKQVTLKWKYTDVQRIQRCTCEMELTGFDIRPDMEQIDELFAYFCSLTGSKAW